MQINLLCARMHFAYMGCVRDGWKEYGLRARILPAPRSMAPGVTGFPRVRPFDLDDLIQVLRAWEEMWLTSRL